MTLIHKNVPPMLHKKRQVELLGKKKNSFSLRKKKGHDDSDYDGEGPQAAAALRKKGKTEVIYAPNRGGKKLLP